MIDKTGNIRPVMLVIMDGCGWREEEDGNAFRIARTPNLDRYREEYPFTLLQASGKAVGLPAGQMGNSEVGHLNLGAGRIVYQELTRINMAIEDGSFFKNAVLCKAMEGIKASPDARLHLMGLVSDGGVHSQMEHLFALLKMAADLGLGNRVCVHAFMDGRDTPPKSGVQHLQRLMEEMDRLQSGTIASVCGRYYAMDRDKRWDRVERAYEMLVRGRGHLEKDPIEAVRNAYARGETDEFITPVLIENQVCKKDDNAGGPLSDGDSVIFFNFRADRARELTRALTEKDFSFFDVHDRPRLASYVTMTRYDESFELPVAFPPAHLVNILGEWASKAGLRQLRISETEKYAHVTYFFNGGEEEPFPGEDRILIPSPREVPTYDLKPEMSARKIAVSLKEAIEKDIYQMIVVNFANGDMVGHTGVMEAAIKACEVVDECVGLVTESFRSRGGSVIITADHGNCEVMKLPDGSPATAHTTNPVPCYLVDDQRRSVSMQQGILADVAPTMLAIAGLSTPDEMTGKALFST